jgi:small-conductance mechanosensitive channel/CRP-like cAMP-binding protein
MSDARLAPVPFLVALWQEAIAAQSLWLIGLVATIAVLSRVLKTHRLRLRALGFLFSVHLVLLALAAGFAGVGAAVAADFRIPAWVCGAVCFVGCGSALLFNVLLPRLGVRVPRIVEDVMVGILSVVTGVMVAGRSGVNLSGLIATSAVFTAMLGFSLQDVIGNVAGGLALQVDNSVEVGDWIRVNDVVGRVVDIRWRYTSVETRNWETVLLPNALLMKSQVTVLGRRQGQPKLWRRWVYFSVDWRHQPSEVIEAVQNAVRGAGIEHVAEEPAAQCVLMDMTESAGKYAVRYWLTDLASDDPTDSEVRNRVYFALHRAGMRPAIPAHALFVHEEDQTREAVKTQKQLARRRALLGRVDLFGGLAETERDEIASQLKYAPFARGELMTRQGAEAHWLYLVEEGQASVHVRDGSLEKEVARLGEGSFFGEMSLLTGAPRSATVVADTDVECFRLDKAAFQRVLERRPEIAGQLAALLSRRQTELNSARVGLDAEATRLQQAKNERDLLNRIRAFFSLKG